MRDEEAGASHEGDGGAEGLFFVEVTFHAGAVGFGDAVEAVAAFDRGIGVDDGGEEVLEVAVAGAIEGRCDVLAFGAELVAGEAGCEGGFSFGRVAGVFGDVGLEVVNALLGFFALLGDTLTGDGDDVFGGGNGWLGFGEALGSGEIEFIG